MTTPGTIAVPGVLDAFPTTEPPATTTAATTTEPAQLSFVDELGGLVGDGDLPDAPVGVDVVRDETGRVSIRVPREWADRSTTTARLDEGADAPYVAASPDLQAFLDGYEVPGLTLVVLPPSDDPAAALDSYRFADTCTDAGIKEYSTDAFEGVYQVWQDCGGTATDIVTVVAVPPDGSFTAVTLTQILSATDLAALDDAFHSLRVRE
jgi:serine protease Do